MDIEHRLSMGGGRVITIRKNDTQLDESTNDFMLIFERSDRGEGEDLYRIYLSRKEMLGLAKQINMYIGE